MAASPAAAPAVPRPFRLAAFLRLSLGLHALGALVLLAAPGQWRAVLGLVLLDHAAISAAVLTPRGRLLGPNMNRLADARRGVALTFDDGPDPDLTPRVLDLLDRHGAKATFFCIGERVLRHPELTREIVARGHEIGNHTFTHPSAFAFYTKRALEGEVRRAQDAIASCTGRRPKVFRAPVGFRGPWLESCLAREGLVLVSWTRRGFDGVSSDADAVLRRLTKALVGGDILLLHDGRRGSFPKGRSVVLEVLPRLLEELRARGLASVPLSD